MLKRRVMIGLMFDDGVLTRTKRFRADYAYTQQFLTTSQADEVVLVDITRGGPSEKSWAAMTAYADLAMLPTAMGGWVRSLEDVRRFISGSGADKVVLGRAALENPGFIEEIAHKWGSQAVTVACDVLEGEVVHGATGRRTGFRAEEWALAAEKAGAGEICLQSVRYDGSLLGFDLPTLRLVANSVSIPVVIGTGCGSWRHIEAAFEAGANGAVTQNIHHFTETALKGFKERLRERGAAVRAA